MVPDTSVSKDVFGAMTTGSVEIGNVKSGFLLLPLFFQRFRVDDYAGIFARRIDQTFALRSRARRIFQCKFGLFEPLLAPYRARSNMISVIKLATAAWSVDKWPVAEARNRLDQLAEDGWPSWSTSSRIVLALCVSNSTAAVPASVEPLQPRSIFVNDTSLEVPRALEKRGRTWSYIVRCRRSAVSWFFCNAISRLGSQRSKLASRTSRLGYTGETCKNLEVVKRPRTRAQVFE